MWPIDAAIGFYRRANAPLAIERDNRVMLAEARRVATSAHCVISAASGMHRSSVNQRLKP